MDKKIKLLKVIGISFFVIVVLGQTTLAQASGSGRDDHREHFSHYKRDSHYNRNFHDYHYNNNYHHRYPYGRIEIVRPNALFSIVFGGGKFYYGAGLFYRQAPEGYVVVPAPIGAIVYTIPNNCNRVVIDGDSYFVYDGVYYRRVAMGYQVVQPPAPVVLEPATVVANPAGNQGPESFTVNVPNYSGGYVPVTIKRSGTGFIGPQGEYYSEFPKVEQLRAMYIK